jgi:hypothetical protein
VTTDRCPACAALIPSGAAWCTLCFADLRPAPEPAANASAAHAPAAHAPAAHAPAAHAPAAQAAPVAVASNAVAPSADSDASRLLDPQWSSSALLTASPEATEEEQPTWPCLTCGARVAIDLPACSECGMGFMAGLHEPTQVIVPGLGDATHLTSAQKVMLMSIVGGGLMVLLLVGSLILGHLL